MALETKSYTLREIAKKAGVSASTVSNVLNKKSSFVGAETREAVSKIAKELGYRPNRGARQLRTQRNMLLSLQLDSQVVLNNRGRSTMVLHLLLIQGITSYICPRGYHLQLIIPPVGQDIQEISRQVLDQNACDGIILFGCTGLDRDETYHLISRFKENHIPCVTMDQQIYRMGVPTVFEDLSQGIGQAVHRIVELGHQRIGFVGARSKVLKERESRSSFFMRYLKEKGITLDEELIFDVRSELDGYRGTMKLLRNPNPPTCIFYSSDHYALAGYQAITDLGLRVPEDISIVGVDNAPYVQDAHIELATVEQNFFEEGRCLAKLLLDQIEDRDSPVPDSVNLKTRFIERASLGPNRPKEV